MQGEINLLQQKKSVQKKKSAFFKFCLFLLFFVIALTIGEIAYTYFLRTRLANLTDQQSTTLSQITRLDAKRVKFQTLKERLSSISRILPESVKFNQRISAIFQNIPNNVTISEIQADAKKITLQVTSPNLSDINDFLDEGVPRITRDKNIGVAESSIDAVGLGATSSEYTASVIFTFVN